MPLLGNRVVSEHGWNKSIDRGLVVRGDRWMNLGRIWHGWCIQGDFARLWYLMGDDGGWFESDVGWIVGSWVRSARVPAAGLLRRHPSGETIDPVTIIIRRRDYPSIHWATYPPTRRSIDSPQVFPLRKPLMVCRPVGCPVCAGPAREEKGGGRTRWPYDTYLYDSMWLSERSYEI